MTITVSAVENNILKLLIDSATLQVYEPRSCSCFKKKNKKKGISHHDLKLTLSWFRTAG